MTSSENALLGVRKISYITMMILDAQRVPYRSWDIRCRINSKTGFLPRGKTNVPTNVASK